MNPSPPTPRGPTPPPARPAPDSGLPGLPGRLERLKARAPRPGEASFFFHDAHFGREAVKVLPGEYFVHDEDLLLTTTLGSCVAACLWDRLAGVGGMNHFMLPEGEGGADPGRYGSYAMELLINELLKRGASRGSLEAKVFGGAQVIGGMHLLNVGQRNAEFVLDYLKTERIPVVSRDLLDIHARKVCFLPHSGQAMVKRLASTNLEALAAQDRAARLRPVPPASGAGSIDLF